MLVLHIVPADGVGGVELAARHAASRQHGELGLVILDGPTKDPLPPPEHAFHCNGRPGGPGSALRALAHVRRIRPKVVVFSLWKTWLAFLLIKAFAPGVRVVTFLHCDKPNHAIDEALTNLMARLSDQVWADSPETLRARLPQGVPMAQTRTISFLLRRLGAVARAPKPSFVFWGRIKRQKRVDLAVSLVARIPGSHLLLIGPDGGEEALVRRLAETLGVADRITFSGARVFEDIPGMVKGHAFYIQCSTHEGMSMSTVEAMQMGLVPVVTPVGEIARYCRDGDNAIVYRNEEQAAADITSVLADPKTYARLSAAAIDQWAKAPLYDEDFMAAARDLAARDD
jgi:glycosyltransferase involved in cell wall biosynthesis